MYAGDLPKVHLTGNPHVDFFSTRGLSIPTTIRDSAPSFPMESSTPSKKSPWIAGALSLAVPGLGEYYDGSYLKSAIFFGVEVGSWLTAYIYDKKGDDQTALFEDYANQHWSPIRYGLWTYDHATMLNSQTYPSNYDLFYGAEPDTNSGPPFSGLDWDQLNALEDDIRHASRNGYTHQLPIYGDQQYYELIGKYAQFYSGWDDAASDPSFTNIADAEGMADFYPSESSRFKIYANMRAKANSYYDVASAMVGIAILNHILSAIDAAWTAGRVNSSIEAHVGVKLQPTPFGMVPIKEANIRVTF